ncbi:fimbria/pilus outer membrane usher protein [Serratia sp. UGAL515B_01]|uniref:fimbria/pilus outer membrane usher protein n=1 Tax=Serratia sp. UGAL515B_01 TaxID=2986763 RepID=UPI0029537E5C|nr:fimbria/pilus outer membrane usher protein [Serratia sp. UGAL515B_01]WON77970.1 fimbria/pilus outer membrane usher protein [Serratia sp. UGAL515B_01]
MLIIKNKRAFWLICAGYLPGAIASNNLAFTYDKEMLKALGVPVGLVTEAIHDHDIPKGHHEVGVYINGNYLGSHPINFLTNGQIQLDRPTIQLLGINPRYLQPSPNTKTFTWCNGINMEMSYSASKNALKITLPPQYLIQERQGKHPLLRGGNAAFINYDLFNTEFDDRFGRRTSTSGHWIFGANSHGFIFRSNNYFYRTRDQHQTQRSSYNNENYIQKDFTHFGIKLGRFNAPSTFLGVGNIQGMAFNLGKNAITPSAVVDISGVANGSSVVELYQNNTIIYSESVQSGSFHFPQVPVIANNADIDVIIRNNMGISSHYRISRGAIRPANNTDNQLTLYAGHVINEREPGTQNILGIAYTWPFWRQLSPKTEFLSSQAYQGIGGEMSFSWGKENSIYSTVSLSDAHLSNNHRRGIRWSQTFNHGNLYTSLTWQSLHYTDYGVWADNNYGKEKYNLSTGYSHLLSEGYSGSISLGRTAYYDHQVTTSASLGLTHSNHWMTLSTNLGYSTTNNDQLPITTQSQLYAWVSLGIPLQFGTRTIRSRSIFNHFSTANQFSTELSAPVTDNINLALGTSKITDTQDHSTTLQHFIQSSMLTPYSAIGAAYTQEYGSNNSARMLNTTLSGSAAATGEGVIFSAQKVGDSFGIVNTGVKGYTTIDTPSAKVISNHDGLALIPQLHPYHDNLIRLETYTLPRGYFIQNARRDIWVEPGSVASVNFTSTYNRDYLIELDSLPPELGNDDLLTDDTGHIMGFFIDRGVVLVNQSEIKKIQRQQAFIVTSAQKKCVLSLNPHQDISALEVLHAQLDCHQL